MNRVVFFAVVFSIFASCGNNRGSSRKADLSGIDLKIEIERFDKDFWALKNSKNISADLDNLFAKYPRFAPVYFSGVVYFGNRKDTILSILPKFFSDSIACKLYSDALNKFSDVSKIEKQLTEAFRRWRYFFPEKTIPKFIMCVSLLNQNVIVADSLIALGIDKYLGKDYSFYAKNPDNYEYVIQNWNPQKIASDYVSVWLSTEFPFNPQKEQLLDELIYKGKILYLTSSLLERDNQEIIMGYTPEQWQWCKSNEKAMWQTIISEKHLFSADYTLKIKYLNEAPFTLPFTQESPGRAGQYLGWQIVEAYMANNPKVSPLELINNNNAQQILEKSGYNP